MKTAIKFVFIFLLIGGTSVWASAKFGLLKNDTINYLTERVRRGDLRKVVNATGEVGAIQLVSVGSQASGQIKKLHIELGQQVKAGDLVAEIDSVTQANDLALNKAKLKTYEAQLASRKVALKVAQKKYDRSSTLVMERVSAKADLDDAEDTLAAAKAALEETRSLIEQSKIQVSTAETNLGYTRIVAPIDGTVVSIPVEEGQTLNATQTTPTIAEIADLSAMEVKMQISEGDVTKVRPGMKVAFTILSEPQRVFEGALSSVDPGLIELTDGNYSGSTSSAVYYYGKFIAPNQDGLLRIGMTTKNTVIVEERKNALLVPTIALAENNGRIILNIADPNNTVSAREVVAGVSDNLHTEILSGVIEGEEVVTVQMTAEEISNSIKNNQRPRGPRQ